MRRGHVARNVAGLVDPPAQKQSDVATAAEHVRNSARWTVALALGLRQSEALALQWKHIDRLTGTLMVRRSIHRVRGGGLIYEEPTTRRSQRPPCHSPSSPTWSSTESPSAASECSPAPSGTTRTWSSRRPTAGRSTRRPTTTMDIYSHVMPALAGETADRMSALRLPSGISPTAIRDESGRPPEGERPDQRGRAEGTRTPDPHTARPT
jgi:integrase